MRQVFVDTGGFVALVVAEDQMHDRAANVFALAARERWALFTTNAVVIETYSVPLARARDGRRAAVGFLDAIDASTHALMVEPIRLTTKPTPRRSCGRMSTNLTPCATHSVSW